MNPKAGHRYAREHPGHESLNFDFSKNGLDTEKNVFGFVQWVGSPKNFINGGVIFFYSKNLRTKKNEIVGVYGNTEILKPVKQTPRDGFEDNTLISNIKADKELSMLFPISLDADKYSTKRLVPQAGFTYVKQELAGKIISDEINQIEKSGARKEEYSKLIRIFEFATGTKYTKDMLQGLKDEEEQREFQNDLVGRLTKDANIRKEIIRELETLNPQTTEEVEFRGKYYKRDNKTIAQLKIIRGFECQICKTKIKKKDGSFYIEAAHVQMKSQKGPETPSNILILCPNHHKEFDFGDRNIIEHAESKITFKLNGKHYEIDLSLH